MDDNDIAFDQIDPTQIFVLKLVPDHQKSKEVYKSMQDKKKEGNQAFRFGNLEEAYKLNF